MLPTDLKNYGQNRDDDDSFQLIDPDVAIFLLIAGGFAGFVFRNYLG